MTIHQLPSGGPIDVVDRIGARSVPDHRLAMARSPGIGIGERNVIYRDEPDLVQQGIDGLRTALPLSPMWWVSEPMCDLLDHSASTMPAFDLSYIDVEPNKIGLVVFERPLTGIDALADIDDSVMISAMTWRTIVFTVSGKPAYNGVTIRCWTLYRIQDSRRVWVNIGGGTWQEGRSIDDPSTGSVNTDARRHSISEDCRRLAALWRLSAQPGLISEESLKQDKHQIKRDAKAGADQAPVRLLYLRRQSQPHQPGEGTREYHHRWMVSGHWRNQTWGPRGTLRRPTWIAPHIKGPDDKPLDIRPTVKALVR